MVTIDDTRSPVTIESRSTVIVTGSMDARLILSVRTTLLLVYIYIYRISASVLFGLYTHH